jgi:hypothetical protein
MNHHSNIMTPIINGCSLQPGVYCARNAAVNLCGINKDITQERGCRSATWEANTGGWFIRNKGCLVSDLNVKCHTRACYVDKELGNAQVD